MRITICWDGLSGYMCACWRALVAQKGVELVIVSTSSGRTFDARILQGLDGHVLNQQEEQDPAAVLSLVAAHRPQVLVLCGWRFKPFVRLAYAPELASAKRVLAMDTPLKLNWRQWAGRYKLASFLNRMDRVVVAGERSWQFARYLRVPEIKLQRGMYGFDGPLFLDLHARRVGQPGGWPRRFLYMGRYNDVKGIDVMLGAYAKYRAGVSEPWPLTCCGQGPLGLDIARAAGVVDRGFVQPADQPQVLIEHGVLVLLSRYEPWGVALAEGMASGLPVICSEMCGASVELVRTLFNGLSVATDDVNGAAAAMRWMHLHYERLPEMGLHAAELAAPFGSEMWAQRWTHMCHELVGEPG